MKNDNGNFKSNGNVNNHEHGNGIGSIKVISFAISLPSRSDHLPMKIEYPELDSMLDDGYEILDSLPSWGNGNYYFITFVLRSKQAKKVRGTVGFTRNAAGL